MGRMEGDPLHRLHGQADQVSGQRDHVRRPSLLPGVRGHPQGRTIAGQMVHAPQMSEDAVGCRADEAPRFHEDPAGRGAGYWESSCRTRRVPSTMAVSLAIDSSMVRVFRPQSGEIYTWLKGITLRDR